MIEILHSENIEEILANPQNYVDDSEDIALLRVYHEDTNNPIYIMIGVDESEKYYLVVEDNDTSEDHYLGDNETLSDLFTKLLDEITNNN
jgi:hypothetical protein